MPSEHTNGHESPYHRARVAWGRGDTVTIDTMWSDPNGTGGWDGVVVPLDREGCNRLIRALRRARDQAFGVDA